MILEANVQFQGALQLAMTEKASVEIYTNGGHTFKGRVASVSETSIVIDPIAGKDFFGVQIRLSDIVALSAQIRKA